MSKRPIRPVIALEISPQRADKGQYITLSCRLYDKDTFYPVTVSRIFMTISSVDDGTVIWPLEVVKKDATGFDIQIGTEDMQEGHTYLVRVSNNWNLSPSASAYFMIKETSFPIIVPFIPFGFRVPQDPDREIKSKEFITQLDHRVCPRCLEYEGKIWYPSDPEFHLVHVPIHINCRCHIKVEWVNPEKVESAIRKAVQLAKQAEEFEQVAEMVEIVKAVQKQY